MTILLYILTGLLLISAQENVANQRKFPENFLFGTATASYQVEGAWNTSGKGQNIWDFLTQNTNLINDRSTGDIACDSYHLYPRDVEMLKELGVDYYRFSLSWSRILPTGFDYKINKEGIAYYNKLIDLLIANNIRPFVTLYHWDLPQPLQDIGGWSNPHIEKYFTAYSKVAFEHFGDRVKDWLTFNEPMEVCHSGYGSGIKAPAVKLEGIADYLCAQTLLMAHARVFHLYNDDFRPTQKGRIGITLNAVWAEPENPDLASDIQASDIDLQFEFGWFAHPIFSKSGDYPEVMKEKIALKSQEQGFGTSRLPTFTLDEVAFIRGTSDFLGINHYTSCLIKMADETVQYPVPSLYDDTGVTGYQPANWPGNPTVDWLKIVPWGLRKLLIWLKDNYNNPEIIITECGYGDSGGTNDSERVRYYHQYLNAMLDAMDQGVNVTSFIAWSLMDNFEWYAGYTQKFGLYEVDFHDPARPRKPKLSATFYSEIVKSKLISRV